MQDLCHTSPGAAGRSIIFDACARNQTHILHVVRFGIGGADAGVQLEPAEDHGDGAEEGDAVENGDQADKDPVAEVVAVGPVGHLGHWWKSILISANYTGCQKRLSFTKLSFWRSCFQLGRNTYDICDKSGNAQFSKTQFF